MPGIDLWHSHDMLSWDKSPFPESLQTGSSTSPRVSSIDSSVEIAAVLYYSDHDVSLPAIKKKCLKKIGSNIVLNIPEPKSMFDGKRWAAALARKDTGEKDLKMHLAVIAYRTWLVLSNVDALQLKQTC